MDRRNKRGYKGSVSPCFTNVLQLLDLGYVVSPLPQVVTFERTYVTLRTYVEARSVHVAGTLEQNYC